jgi:hypothetical protein
MLFWADTAVVKATTTIAVKQQGRKDVFMGKLIGKNAIR